MHDPELIGFIAGALTTLAFIPQVLKVWMRRSARDISLAMFVCFCTGVALWILYGLLVGSAAVVAANGITFVLAGAILLAKIRFRHGEGGGTRGTGD